MTVEKRNKKLIEIFGNTPNRYSDTWAGIVKADIKKDWTPVQVLEDSIQINENIDEDNIEELEVLFLEAEKLVAEAKKSN